jgi:hypothetical protein
VREEDTTEQDRDDTRELKILGDQIANVCVENEESRLTHWVLSQIGVLEEQCAKGTDYQSDEDGTDQNLDEVPDSQK